jgi:hypothetical protein
MTNLINRGAYLAVFFASCSLLFMLRLDALAVWTGVLVVIDLPVLWWILG